MRKRIIASTQDSSQPKPEDQRWLDLEALATVEVTSEEKEFPIESALLSGVQAGWRAATPGSQTVRLRFDKPQKLSRVQLRFEEMQMTRTQEFVLRYSSDSEGAFRDIVRQQWNFSGPDSLREMEDYTVDLPDVAALELTIVPDISGGPAHASLLSLRLA
jgi:hypothetical protein